MSQRTLRPIPNTGSKHSLRSSEHAVNVILIPSPGGLKVDEWAVSASNTQLRSSSGANVLSFDYPLAVGDTFTWSGYLKHGYELVDALSILCEEADTKESLRPTVLLAHSLGGFILKQFLIHLHNQLETYKELRDSITGLIFLGCPHSNSRRESLYESSVSVLQSAGLATKSTVAKRLSSRDDNDLLDICKEFDSASVRIEMLSVYEHVQTTWEKPRGVRDLRRSRQSAVLVDDRLAMIDSDRYEDLIGVGTDHRNLPLCRDRSGRLHEVFTKRLQQLLGKAPEVLRGRQTPRADSPFSGNSLVLRPLAGGLRPPAPALKPLIERFSPPRPKLVDSCFMLDTSRPRNPDFCGRESILRELDLRLLQATRMSALHGMGGVGKSEVSLEWVYRCKEQKSFEAVFWLQAANLEKLRADFGRIASELCFANGLEPPSDPFIARDVAKAWLIDPIVASLEAMIRPADRPPEKARWLIVFDGADDLKVLKEFEELRGKGAILITSRDPDVECWVAPSTTSDVDTASPSTINLQVMQEDAAALMLTKLSRADEDNAAARQIVRSLGRWPLAIYQMAGIIRNEYLTLSEFAKRYGDRGERQNFQALEPASETQAVHDTMVTTLRKALLGPKATALLGVCAMLAPECIQERLFYDVSPETSVSLPNTQIEFQHARAELLRASLLKRNTARREFSMHRVVQDTVRNSMTPSSFDITFREAVRLVARNWKSPGPDGGDNLEEREQCKVLFPHVLHLQAVHPTHADDSCSCEHHVKPCLQFARLLNDSAWLQLELGNTSGLKSMLNLARLISVQLPESETFDLLSDIYHSLGAWANETNHAKECLEYNERYMRMRQDAVNEGARPDRRTAAAWNQYGTGEMMMKRYSEAKVAFRTSIDIYRGLPDGVPCKDSLPMVNLAVAEWLSGDNEAALRWLEPGLLAREEAFGMADARSFHTGRFYHTLGNVRQSQGRLDESEIWHKRALKQYQSTIGNMHHRTADVCHRVAEHCLRLGHPIWGSALIEQALKTWRTDKPSFIPEIARTTFLKAQYAALAANPVQKRQLLEEAADLRSIIEPEDGRPAEELKTEDFDELVAFWSR